MFTAFPEAPRREHSLSWEKSTNLCFLLFGSFRTFGCSLVRCLAHGHFCLKPVRTCCDPLRLDQNSWDLKSLLLDYSFLLLGGPSAGDRSGGAPAGCRSGTHGQLRIIERWFCCQCHAERDTSTPEWFTVVHLSARIEAATRRRALQPRQRHTGPEPHPQSPEPGRSFSRSSS